MINGNTTHDVNNSLTTLPVSYVCVKTAGAADLDGGVMESAEGTWR